MSWDRSGSSGGLPPQWSNGGHGNVTAAVDDPSTTPLTVSGPVGSTAGVLVLNTPDDGSGYTDVLTVVGDKGGPNEQNVFALDSAGEFIMQVIDNGASGLVMFAPSGATDNHMLQISGANPNGPIFDVENGGKVTVGNSVAPNGLKLGGPNAAPADAALDQGQLMFWFDKTNGAAKLMLKAKTANGTVVAGSVALA